MDGRNGGFNLERTRRADRQSAFEERGSLGDVLPIPARPILLGQRDGQAILTETGRTAGLVQKEQRQQPPHLGVPGKRVVK